MLEVLFKCNLGPLTNTALQHRYCTTIFFPFSTENTKRNVYTGNWMFVSTGS